MRVLATESDALYITMNSSSNVFWTILTGVTIFVLGQIFIEAVLKPYMRYKQIKSKISYCLILYGNLYNNPLTICTYRNDEILEPQKAEYEKAATELRKLASELTGFTEETWKVNVYIPKNKDIAKAASGLIGLSNSMVTDEAHYDCVILYNAQKVKEIKEAMKIMKDIEL